MLFWFRRIEPIDRLVVDIGSSDSKYSQTRHNVGFHVVNLLAKQLGVKREEVRFKGAFASAKLNSLIVGSLKPITYFQPKWSVGS